MTQEDMHGTFSAQVPIHRKTTKVKVNAHRHLLEKDRKKTMWTGTKTDTESVANHQLQ